MGPLDGLRVIEIAGLGPGPFAAMLLADMGADVIRVDRPSGGLFSAGAPTDLLNRGKRSLCVDLKNAEGVETVLRLVDGAEALIEGFRPGVVEKLGIGPDVCLARNPRLAYGRMTGWGQDGPLAQEAGHDINYIALSGALHAIGRRGEAPAIPLNLVGDFGGGGLLLAFGLVCAMLEARTSGKGQVVDAAMVDGAALLMASIYGAHQTGYWSDERGTHMLDSGAHFYDVYETADGRWISIGSIEPAFYGALLEKLGLAGETLPDQMDQEAWPRMKERFAAIFKTKTRDEWCRLFEDSDACFAPVLGMSEVHEHPHAVARDAFHEIHGARQPRPAPRFSRTPAEVSRPPAALGAQTDEILREVGCSAEEIARLRESQAIR
ncbi:MAG TPA: CaiB/BaiF CoA-transferase family protein [Myxococcota bacterium]|nr:CaiB/BaiF CoA-transferase family protein [Myxococcota bacterium]